MLRCTTCEQTYPDNAPFCPNDGTKLVRQSTPSIVPTPPQSPQPPPSQYAPSYPQQNYYQQPPGGQNFPTPPQPPAYQPNPYTPNQSFAQPPPLNVSVPQQKPQRDMKMIAIKIAIGLLFIILGLLQVRRAFR